MSLTSVFNSVEHSKTGARKRAPVFVLGAPRSGTTLLYHMLLSAGGFAIYRTESNFFNLLEPKFGDLKLMRNRKKLLNVWLESKLFLRSGLDREHIKATFLEDRNDRTFLQILMEEIARSQHVERWADCTPDHLLYLTRIKAALPEALIVHIIRDGRDVAASIERQGWIRPFPWDRQKRLLVAGLFWEWIVSKGRSQADALGADYLEIRFEDLIARPGEILGILGQFIDHDLDYERILHDAVGSVREPNTSFENESRQSGFNPVGRWKRLFSSKELLQFETQVGPFLETLGYPLAIEGHETRRSGAEFRTVRFLYQTYFDAKLWLKAETPLGALLISSDLSYL